MYCIFSFKAVQQACVACHPILCNCMLSVLDSGGYFSPLLDEPYVYMLPLLKKCTGLWSGIGTGSLRVLSCAILSYGLFYIPL